MALKGVQILLALYGIILRIPDLGTDEYNGESMATMVNHTLLIGELVLFCLIFHKLWSPETFDIDLASVMEKNMENG